MRVIAIIPARMGSSRFPGKPLAKICGVPMVGHCFYRTQMCDELSGTYVATCDQEIYDYITSIGGNAVMTANSHERASDRTAEAMLKIESELGEKVDIVVMVQGDEPLVTPSMISKSVEPFSDASVNVVNLMAKIDRIEDFTDPNEIKVVVNASNNAIYFSRSPIPSQTRDVLDSPLYKQVCIIPYRRDYLIEFNSMAETVLERSESIDMLRIIENDGFVRMVEIDTVSYSVDTESRRSFVESIMENDDLRHLYG
jgi:3-deoxy-manno-octulosonate cytidylyltransferase (CMP-KDO synthetase)